MNERRIVLIVGGDALALDVCEHLARSASTDVRFVWHERAALRARVESHGARFYAGDYGESEVLHEAGIAQADTVMAIDIDDRVNLDVALLARECNPETRVVLRQFNRRFARKVEENFTDCSVVSLSAYSAATYAAVAVNPACYAGVQFPQHSGALYGFVLASAGSRRYAGKTIAECERDENRILVVNDEICPSTDRELQEDDRLVLFERIVLERHDFRRVARFFNAVRRSLEAPFERASALIAEIDGMLRLVLASAVVVYVAATVFFAWTLGLPWLTAAYFVTTTMTTTGYGDIALVERPGYVKIGGMAAMLGGVVIANLAVAFLSAALVRAQWVALQGLRAIRARDHIVVFGAGRVGTRIIEYLRSIRIPVVVVERAPTSMLVRYGREAGVSLLTGDATDDETLDMCNIPHARSVVVTTENDATNLEIGLGARARKPLIPVIMRIGDERFARRIAREFNLRRVFSAQALATPAFVGLTFSQGALGQVRLGHTLFDIEQTNGNVQSPSRRTIPLVQREDGVGLRLIETDVPGED